MKRDQSKNRFAAAFLVFSLLFGTGIVLSTTAQAQNPDDRYDRDHDNVNQKGRGRDWDRYGNYGGSVELRRTALNASYNEGVREGRKDRGARNTNGYQGQRTYQKATKSRLGDREVYQRYFREAYEHGYADGYTGH